MNRPLLALGFFVFLLSPVSVSAATITPVATEWEYIRDASGKYFGNQITKDASYDEDDLLSVYRMRKGELTDYLRTRDKIVPTDKSIWDMFVGISDKETIAKRILIFGTYEDAADPTLGFVSRLGKKEPSWMLAVNANAARPESVKWRREMSIVLLHEYAHILTLKTDQLDKKKRAATQCTKLGTYHAKGFACTKTDSYLNAFVQKFWTKEEIAAALKANERAVTKEFYNEGKNEDNYVTWYAASGPEEDIAESFVDFVLRRKPVGTTEKEQKILFFYSYPELVKMRDQIRANFAPDFSKNSSI